MVGTSNQSVPVAWPLIWGYQFPTPPVHGIPWSVNVSLSRIFGRPIVWRVTFEGVVKWNPKDIYIYYLMFMDVDGLKIGFVNCYDDFISIELHKIEIIVGILGSMDYSCDNHLWSLLSHGNAYILQGDLTFLLGINTMGNWWGFVWIYRFTYKENLSKFQDGLVVNHGE